MGGLGAIVVKRKFVSVTLKYVDELLNGEIELTELVGYMLDAYDWMEDVDCISDNESDFTQFMEGVELSIAENWGDGARVRLMQELEKVSNFINMNKPLVHGIIDVAHSLRKKGIEYPTCLSYDVNNGVYKLEIAYTQIEENKNG